jgi:hypothetical protein
MTIPIHRKPFSALNEDIEVTWNLELFVEDRGKRKIWHQRTHNIVVNIGREYQARTITPATLGAGGSFTRHDDTVMRYIGFGIGGARQSSTSASATPLSDAPPAGYAGTNTQPDDDPSVARLERPVRVSGGPDVWMQQIVTPGTFPSFRETTFIANFGPTALSYGSFISVPLSEIGLYKSSADPTLPNGAAGAYPGGTGHMTAYDTFDPFSKTGGWTIQARWTFRY